MSRLMLRTALLAAVAALAGCASRPVVQGKVLYRNEALTSGEVSFVASDGRSRSAQIGSDGSYEIIDPPLGEVTIVVVATKVEGGSAKGSPLGGDPKGSRAGTTRSLIPARYNDPKSSGLTYHVTRGRQTKDVELKD